MTSDELNLLIKLDSEGFFPAPHEDISTFFRRAEQTAAAHEKFEKELAENGEAAIFDVATVKSEDRISGELIEDSAAITEKLYRFSARNIPGFYLTKAVGLLWGGCMLSDPDEHLSVFLLRNVFRKRRKFLNYERSELLAHELCHTARQSLSEWTLEEYFAYQTSDSAFRRYMGNCFIHDRDALFFLLPIMMLPLIQILHFTILPALPLLPFWLLALCYPCFLLWRNARSHSVVRRARKVLLANGITEIEPILFRCTLEELRTIGDFKNGSAKFFAWADDMSGKELRWAVIKKRFFKNSLEITL